MSNQLDQIKSKQGDIVPTFVTSFCPDFPIKSFGIELGNWYGYIALPRAHGMCSQFELVDLQETLDSYSFQALVVMPKLKAMVSYSSYMRSPVELVSEVFLEFVDDSYLGDLVIHNIFSPKEVDDFSIGMHKFKFLNKYRYFSEKDLPLDIETSAASVTAQASVESSDDLGAMMLIPYSALIQNDEVRFHSRLLCMAKGADQILFRTRGSMSCVKLPFNTPLFASLLYRKEKKASRLFPNTQLCAVKKFLKGQKIVLTQVLRRLK